MLDFCWTLFSVFVLTGLTSILLVGLQTHLSPGKVTRTSASRSVSQSLSGFGKGVGPLLCGASSALTSSETGQLVMQEEKTLSHRLPPCNVFLRDVVGDFRPLPAPRAGRDARAAGLYLSRRVYLPFRSRLLLKWMENQRNEVRTIP